MFVSAPINTRMGKATRGNLMDSGTRAAFTAVDTGDVDLILTGDEDLADWAERRGYRVRAADQDGATVYEIWPGDAGPEQGPPAPL
jgi:hypothetical protein